MTYSNFRGGARAAVRFTATIPSGSPTSETWPYEMSDFANGCLSFSGTIPAAAGTTHATVLSQTHWSAWMYPAQYDSGFSDVCAVAPTGNTMIMMPPALFGLVGPARLALTNGSGSGIPATAAVVVSIGLKS